MLLAGNIAPWATAQLPVVDRALSHAGGCARDRASNRNTKQEGRRSAMNIVVLVKQVPDSGADRNLRTDDNTVDRGSANNVINEMDEYAIEEALKIKEAHGGEVTILTMGPDRATESIRKALSMGPDKAVHVVDDALHGSCAVATSKVLAAALGQLNADLVICGAESTD